MSTKPLPAKPFPLRHAEWTKMDGTKRKKVDSFTVHTEDIRFLPWSSLA